MDISIDNNYGNVVIGDGGFICRCGEGCSRGAVTQAGSLPREFERIIEDGACRSVDETNRGKICLCSISKPQEHLENSISNIVTGVIRDKNCSNFELNLQIKSKCQICRGNSTGHLLSVHETETYSSEEFEVNLSHLTTSSLQRAECSDEETCANQWANLEARKILENSPQQQLVSNVVEGNFIQIKTRVHKNGTKINFKLRFDVRRSCQRRCHTFSDIKSLRKESKYFTRLDKIKSLSNVQAEILQTRSNTSLSAAKSSITIDELSLDMLDVINANAQNASAMSHKHLSVPLRLPCPGALSTVNEQLSELLPQTVEEVDALDLDYLMDQPVFAKGQFGPLYKITKGNKEILVKIVGDNPKFLEDAKQFRNCTHPFIRSTVDVVENGQRSYVTYRFVDGKTLCEAMQTKLIADYITYFRILFGIVKGLCYLKEKGIHCRLLTTQKVLLDKNFNPRICGVGLADFDSTEHARTKGEELHRSLSYFDLSLRSRDDKSPKNVMWSVGRIIWEILLGQISQCPGKEDLLEKHRILDRLNEPCDDKKIKTVYFSANLRKIVHATGWPKDKEITKSLVVCAVRCMLLNLNERMSLDDLHAVLMEFYDLQKRERFSLYQVLPDNLCIFCMENTAGQLALTCGCGTACNECLRNATPLDCPDHGKQFSRIGHPLTYGVIIQGDFHENKNVCENDSSSMERLYKDQNIFAVKNFDRITSTTEREACKELERVKIKIMGDKKAKDSDRYPTTLILFISGHCNEAGNLVCKDKSILKKKNICNFVYDINAKNVVVMANGHYSEKLVKHLSQVRSNFFNSCAFFGVFSHGSNLCNMSVKSVCEKNSTTVKFILDIFKNDLQKSSSSSYDSASKRHLTIGQLIQLVSDRLHDMCGKCLRPIERNGAAHLPVAYV